MSPENEFTIKFELSTTVRPDILVGFKLIGFLISFMIKEI